MKYDAFISYSHAKDSVLAPNIERALEKFGKPLFKKRALEIFRDANDLSASPDLWEKIEQGIDNSGYFIFMASEEAAESIWCQKEVEHWKKTKNIDNLLIVLTNGELIWDHEGNDFDWSRTTAIPRTLSGAFKGEPLYVDYRTGFDDENLLSLENPNFKRNIVLLAATIHQKTVGDMVGEAAMQHKRTLRIRNGVILGLTCLLFAAIGFAFYAFNQKELAEYQTNRALLANYESNVQSEFEKDPTKALRLAEYAYTFAKENGLPDQVIRKRLIQVFYGGNAFYLEHDIKSDSLNKDIKRYGPGPDIKYCFEEESIPVSKRDVLFSPDQRFAVVDHLVLIEPELYRYCNYFFPSVRERKRFKNERYPITDITFVNNGSELLTESRYWPWDPEEFRPMPDGNDEFFYHLYNTETTPYIENQKNLLQVDSLRQLLYGQGNLQKIEVKWPMKVKTRVSSPIKEYNIDSTMYANNLGAFTKDGEKLIGILMPMDDLSSNYSFAFSEDSNFFYVQFRPVGPLMPELDRTYIFPLHPELIIHRLNTMYAPQKMASLTDEDKERFLISLTQNGD